MDPLEPSENSAGTAEVQPSAVSELFDAASTAALDGDVVALRAAFESVLSAPAVSPAERAKAEFSLAVLDVDDAGSLGERVDAVAAAAAAAAVLAAVAPSDPSLAAMRAALDELRPGALSAALDALDAGDVAAARSTLAASLDAGELSGVVAVLAASELVELLLADGDVLAAVGVAQRWSSELAADRGAGWALRHLLVSALCAAGALAEARVVAVQLAADASGCADERRFVYAALPAEVDVLSGDPAAIDALEAVLSAAVASLGVDAAFVSHVRAELAAAAMSLGRPEVAVTVLGDELAARGDAEPSLRVCSDLAAALLAAGDPSGSSELLAQQWPRFTRALRDGDPVGLSAAVTHISAVVGSDPAAGADEALALWRWLAPLRSPDAADAEVARQLAVEALVVAGRAPEAFELVFDVVRWWRDTGCSYEGAWWVGVLADVAAASPVLGLDPLREVLADTAPVASHRGVAHAVAVAVALLLAAGDADGAAELSLSHLSEVEASGAEPHRVALARRAASAQLLAAGRSTEAAGVLAHVCDLDAADLSAVALDLPVWARATAAAGDVDAVEVLRAQWVAAVADGGPRAGDVHAQALGRVVASALTGAGGDVPASVIDVDAIDVVDAALERSARPGAGTG